MITRLNDLLQVSQLTETSQNVPKRTRTDRNGPKRTYRTTETDSVGAETNFTVYRNGAETNTMGTRKGRPGNGRKQVYVCGGGI